MYLVQTSSCDSPGSEKSPVEPLNNENNQFRNNQYQQQHKQYHHQTTKTVTIVAATPQRSNSLDYLNFEEKRQIIASSLSLSEFLTGPAAAAAAAAKEVAANTVGKH